MNQNPSISMRDKEMLQDSLDSQKQMTGAYNLFANECASTALRNEVLNILRDEHSIQADIWNEMQKRGWYPIKQADEKQVQEAKARFTSQNTP